MPTKKPKAAGTVPEVNLSPTQLRNREFGVICNSGTILGSLLHRVRGDRDADDERPDALLAVVARLSRDVGTMASSTMQKRYDRIRAEKGLPPGSPFSHDRLLMQIGGLLHDVFVFAETAGVKVEDAVGAILARLAEYDRRAAAEKRYRHEQRPTMEPGPAVAKAKAKPRRKKR